MIGKSLPTFDARAGANLAPSLPVRGHMAMFLNNIGLLGKEQNDEDEMAYWDDCLSSVPLRTLKFRITDLVL